MDTLRIPDRDFSMSSRVIPKRLSASTIKNMSAVRPADELPCAAPVPQLLVKLPSRPRVFFGNLWDLVFPRRLAPLELCSAPAAFWPDVFVTRGLPWKRFLQSGAYHFIAGALLIGLTHLFALQPRVAPIATFDHSQVIYYQALEYLPPLDTGDESNARPRKADPEFSRQPIISVPPEADNREQTIVALPSVELKRTVAMPNIVAWSDRAEKPRLAIPPAPLTLAADITRLAPRMESSVVGPPPDAARLAYRRNASALQRSVAAPPADLRASSATAGFHDLQPSLIAPPPNVESASTRQLGDLNIAPSPVIAPAPQLPLSARRTISAGRSALRAGSPPVVPPPPSLSAAGSSGASVGSGPQVIALNLHPAVDAPADPPAGNRRGTFAATPEGHAGASGVPGSTLGDGTSNTASRGSVDSKGNAGESPRKGTTDLPSGLYVGNAAAKASPVSADPTHKVPENSVNPNLVASVRTPRVSSTRPPQSESATKLSEPERAVFGNRKFYSVTLNLPNLNSAGGSWVIRFAELNHGSSNQESDNHDPNAPAANLSQPTATRKVDPAYPAQLMRENVSGTVILYAVIHADGSVGDVRVLRSVDARLDRFAREAVTQWKFEPATKNGSPVDVEATFQIPFRPPSLRTNF